MATLAVQLAPEAVKAFEGFPVQPHKEGQVHA